MAGIIGRFIADERGLEVLEYAVLTALIVAAIATAVVTLVASVGGRYGAVQTTLDGLG